MSTTIFMGIEGVLSPSIKPDDMHEGYLRTLNDKTGLSGWKFMKVGLLTPVSEELINSINRLSKKKDINFCWLTTWEKQASYFAQQIGLDAREWVTLIPSNYTPTHANKIKHARLAAMQDYLKNNPAQSIVWVGAGLPSRRNISSALREAGVTNSIILETDSYKGITKKQLNEIL